MHRCMHSNRQQSSCISTLFVLSYRIQKFLLSFIRHSIQVHINDKVIYNMSKIPFTFNVYNLLPNLYQSLHTVSESNLFQEGNIDKSYQCLYLLCVQTLKTIIRVHFVKYILYQINKNVRPHGLVSLLETLKIK